MPLHNKESRHQTAHYSLKKKKKKKKIALGAAPEQKVTAPDEATEYFY
jgi:hypothetical protein